jgi:hypothetical protein
VRNLSRNDAVPRVRNGHARDERFPYSPEPAVLIAAQLDGFQHWAMPAIRHDTGPGLRSGIHGRHRAGALVSKTA